MGSGINCNAVDKHKSARNFTLIDKKLFCVRISTVLSNFCAAAKFFEAKLSVGK